MRQSIRGPFTCWTTLRRRARLQSHPGQGRRTPPQTPISSVQAARGLTQGVNLGCSTHNRLILGRRAMEGSTPSRVQILDAGPRGAANLEAMSALSTGKRGKLCFFKGDEGGTPIGSHTVFDFSGHQQNVGMVQTWNQCQQMVLTTEDKPESLLLMDTETGSTLSELEMRRQQRNWKLSIDSVTPMQKFEQYKATNEYSLFGLGDGGKTVFALNHDSRAGENVEEFIIRADSSRKYKSYTFTCHAQTRAGNLALGRTDGGVALYDAIMQSENASCVLDGMPGPVTSLDVAADGSMIVWTTPEFVFFSSPSEEHWTKGKKVGKPAVLPLAVAPADLDKMLASSSSAPSQNASASADTSKGQTCSEPKHDPSPFLSPCASLSPNVRSAATQMAARRCRIGCLCGSTRARRGTSMGSPSARSSRTAARGRCAGPSQRRLRHGSCSTTARVRGRRPSMVWPLRSAGLSFGM